MKSQKKQRKLLDVDVVDIGAKGKAIGKTKEGEIVLIEGAVPGDVVDLIRLRNRKGMKYGRVENFKAYSELRQEAFCAHFSDCGGCKWQNLQYEHQLAFKARSIQETLRRIGKVDTAHFLPPLAAPETTRYRNKLEYTFSAWKWLTEEDIQSGKQIGEKRGAGFHPPGNFRKVVDIEKCWLQREPSNETRNFVRHFALEKDWTFYDVGTHKGFLRTMIVRTTEDGQNMLILTFGEVHEENARELMDAILEKFSIDSLYYVFNLKWNDSITDLTLIHYAGEKFIIEQIDEVKYRIGPKSFFQTNTQQAQNLYRLVLSFADLSMDDTVYDLYTGLGSIALQAASKCKLVVGIEEVEAAIHDAKWNAELNKIENAYFYAGDALLFADDTILGKHGKPDVLITDPPRAGMHAKVVEKILELAPDRIVYVSCNPATQARDLELLKSGYEIAQVQAVDMFPHTSHMESIALLTKSNK